MTKKRELTLNEVHKADLDINMLQFFIEDISPHQLELLIKFAWKILSGKKLDK